MLERAVRTLNRNVREKTVQHIRTLAEGIEQVTGAKLEVNFRRGSPSVQNDEEITNLVSRVAGELLGETNVQSMARPSMGSEDFAYYLERVPGMMFRLGAAGTNGPWPGLHTPTFDVDEKCPAVGAKIFARTDIEWAKQ